MQTCKLILLLWLSFSCGSPLSCSVRRVSIVHRARAIAYRASFPHARFKIHFRLTDVIPEKERKSSRISAESVEAFACWRVELKEFLPRSRISWDECAPELAAPSAEGGSTAICRSPPGSATVKESGYALRTSQTIRQIISRVPIRPYPNIVASCRCRILGVRIAVEFSLNQAWARSLFNLAHNADNLRGLLFMSVTSKPAPFKKRRARHPPKATA